MFFFLSDEEEKHVSQSSDFDFDEVDESFCQKMRDNTNENMPVNNDADTASLSTDKDDTHKDRPAYSAGGNDMKIIVLTSDTEVDGEGISTLRDIDLHLGSQKTDLPPHSKHETSEPVQPEKPDKQDKPENSAKPVEDSDSAPSLISAEDLSKLAAKNTTVADEPPVLTKMNPTRRVSNTLEDMISRLTKRVLTAHPSSSDSSVNGTDGPTPMDIDQSLADDVDKSATEKSPSVENALGIRVEPISEPSSPETENMESFPPSPSSLRSDVSKPESLDQKSEISTGSSKRSTGVSKPPAKKLKSKIPLYGLSLIFELKSGVFDYFALKSHTGNPSCGSFPLYGARLHGSCIHPVQVKIAKSADEGLRSENSSFRFSHYNSIYSNNSNAQLANTVASLFT